MEPRNAPGTPAAGTRLSEAEIHDDVLVAAEEELRRPVAELAWSGLEVGLAIGYPLGFVFVVLARSQLFTENTLEPVIPLLARQDRSTLVPMLRLWAIALPANLAGACIFALLAAWTPLFRPRHAPRAVYGRGRGDERRLRPRLLARGVRGLARRADGVARRLDARDRRVDPARLAHDGPDRGLRLPPLDRGRGRGVLLGRGRRGVVGGRPPRLRRARDPRQRDRRRRARRAPQLRAGAGGADARPAAALNGFIRPRRGSARRAARRRPPSRPPSCGASRPRGSACRRAGRACSGAGATRSPR